MVTSKKIDIRYGSLFPWTFRFLAVLVLIAGLSQLVDRPFLSFALLLVGGFILSAAEGIVIDPTEKNYREYNSFFFLKSGAKVKYSGIEKIFVGTSKTKQQVHTAYTNNSSIFENMQFNGFLKFNDGTKIKLLSKRKKEDLINALNKIAKLLDVPVEDNTSVGESL